MKLYVGSIITVDSRDSVKKYLVEDGGKIGLVRVTAYQQTGCPKYYFTVRKTECLSKIIKVSEKIRILNKDIVRQNIL